MNVYIGKGRLTRDPDVRMSQNESEPMAIARYTLAIDRTRKVNADQTADFIPCVAFGKNAEFAEKYLKKGTKIIIRAHFQSGSYTNKDGQKIYTLDAIIDTQEFAESKAVNNGEHDDSDSSESGDMNVPDGVEDEGLPFN
jgi:single-strand DNA-binding protein